MKKTLSVTLSCMALGSALSLNAAIISWGSASDIVNSNDVSTAGTLVEAFSLGDSDSPTVNGVTFTNTTLFSASADASKFNSGMTGDYGGMLQSLNWESDPNTVITSSLGGGNLVIGNEYEIQIWFSHAADGRAIIYGDGEASESTVTLTLSNDGSDIGQYVIGTFTADGTSQNITISTPPATAWGAHMNGYQIRALPAASPSGYELWASTNGVGAATNDFDNDGLNNLTEYGLNGNPTNALDQGTLPLFSRVGNGFIYVHPQRSDDEGLIYTVETTTNLASGIWTNQRYTVTGTNITGETLDFVTNEVDTTDDEKFIRLKIEQ